MTKDEAKGAYNQSLLLRGIILDATIHLERAMDNYLSDYFCFDESKGNELKEMLWNTERVTLSAKKDVFFILLNRYHKEFLKLNPKFIDTIERLIPHRNIFAHLELDLSVENLKKAQFSFIKYKNGKVSPQIYKEETINGLTVDFKSVISILDTLKPPKPSQTSSVATD